MPIRLAEDDGDFAVFIRTDVEMNEWDHDLLPCTKQDFVKALFSPATWPSRHDLWCSMTSRGADKVLSDKLLDARPSPEPAGYKFGTVVGAAPQAFLEVVGSCDDPNKGSFPNTVLHFADSRTERPTAGGAAVDYYLEYRLLQNEPNASLSRDDGVVHVSNHPGRNPRYRFMTTKLVHVRQSPSRSEGQALAEFACVSGWGEQTRRFLLTCGKK